MQGKAELRSIGAAVGGPFGSGRKPKTICKNGQQKPPDMAIAIHIGMDGKEPRRCIGQGKVSRIPKRGVISGAVIPKTAQTV